GRRDTAGLREHERERGLRAVSARWLAALALAALALWPALLAAGPTREEALRALADTRSADTRRQGVRALAETGLMAGLPQLATALPDTDPPVPEPPGGAGGAGVGRRDHRPALRDRCGADAGEPGRASRRDLQRDHPAPPGFRRRMEQAGDGLLPDGRISEVARRLRRGDEAQSVSLRRAQRL